MLIKELANKHFSTTSTSSQVSNIADLLSRTDMDINDNNRERFTSSSRTTSKSISIISNILSCTYHLRMECNNDLLDNMVVDPIDSSQLSYKDNVKTKDNLVSKVTNLISVKDL